MSLKPTLNRSPWAALATGAHDRALEIHWPPNDVARKPKFRKVARLLATDLLKRNPIGGLLKAWWSAWSLGWALRLLYLSRLTKSTEDAN